MTEPFSSDDDAAIRAMVEQSRLRLVQKERLVAFFRKVTELDLHRDITTESILMKFIKEHGELLVFQWIALAAEMDMNNVTDVGKYVCGIRRKFKEENPNPPPTL